MDIALKPADLPTELAFTHKLASIRLVLGMGLGRGVRNVSPCRGRRLTFVDHFNGARWHVVWVETCVVMGVTVGSDAGWGGGGPEEGCQTSDGERARERESERRRVVTHVETCRRLSVGGGV